MAPSSSVLVGTKGKVKSITALLSLVALVSLVLAACGGGNQTTPNTNSKAILKVATQSYDFAQAGFNPYNG
ncbi:MAG TPA: hypothetical protein VFA10_21900, partial [Ktedonobacteraceae bacterium]|nr:hypothetical protein [Ktedonobacteraceae bacterium]